MPSGYFFLGPASFCFNHNRIASATALPRDPFSLPYSAITLILNSLSRSSGRRTCSTPMLVPRYLGTLVPKYLLGVYCILLYLYKHTLDQKGKALSNRISIDAEVVELRLPEDRKIHVKTPRELERIAGILKKPILRELVSNDTGVTDPSSIKKGSCVLAVYDGPWVYYCELEADEQGREDHAP